MEFKDTLIQFEINDSLVVGLLNGDITYWEFRSNSREFKKVFHDGVFKNRISFNAINETTEKLIDALYHSLEDQLIKNPMIKFNDRETLELIGFGNRI
ncbi:MAG: hypothetical protein WCJ80_06875 [Bacteroidota bacterium]|jgi:superfamily I DNA/RNA helicase